MATDWAAGWVENWVEDLPDASWSVAFDSYRAVDEGRREVLLALGNGVFVTRAATIDGRSGRGGVGDAAHYPGTYRAGCYNRLPNRIAGQCDQTESLVRLPDWLPLLFRIDGGPWLRLDEVTLLDYFHGVDLRTGSMQRECLLRDRNGRHLQLSEQRIVSMAQPHLAALRVRLTPLDWSGTLEFRSLLDGDVVNDNVKRFRDYRHRHLVDPHCSELPGKLALLQTRTAHSRVEIAFALRTRVDGDAAAVAMIRPDRARVGHGGRCDVVKGVPLVVEKVVALCTSLDSGEPGAAERAREALADAGDFAALQREHASCWSRLWSRAAIEADDPGLARPLRLHAFHILQTVSPHSIALDAGVPARGWHGEAYHGHVFWDELFVLPFLNLRFPEIARAVLCYRYRRLDAARRAAHEAGFRGAMYPWRSAGDGREVTPRHQKNLVTGKWMPDHTRLQRHIGAAVAFNVWQYWLATGDTRFLVECGAEMVLEIARFWASIAQPGVDGRYEIRGVIGPDEYHNAYPGSSAPGLDNNAYTNVMAVWTLCRGLEVLDHLPPADAQALRRRLALGDDEQALWDRISRNMYIPFHGERILSQFSGFEQLSAFDLESLPPALAGQRPDWALRALGRSADDFRLTKQADVLSLFYLLPEQEVFGLLARLGYAFNRNDMVRNAHYYLPCTTHRSSLSRVVYAGALARVEPALSWQLYRQALTTDLNPLKGQSVAEGVHLGAMGGTLDILQRRYLGLAPGLDGLHLDPALPSGLGRVRLGLRYRGCSLRLEATRSTLVLDSDRANSRDIALIVKGERRTLAPGASLTIGRTA